MTKALKTSNIKTVLFILRTIDKERESYCTRDVASHISSTSNTSATPRDVSVSAMSKQTVISSALFAAKP